ncbi:MAG: C4-dicarboxylate transporter DcuC [Cellulosilyticaceae bacterium]
MNIYVMMIIAALAVGCIGYMLVKKMDIKITLLAVGIVLMYVAIVSGQGISMKGFESTGISLIDPIYAVVEQFKSTLPAAGLIILMLGGYSAYMGAIGANDVTVSVMTKPLVKIKSVYVLVPVVFILGNILSLVVPSASNLAIILLATLYPILRSTGMSPLTVAAIIATSATCVPTPLGGDNVAIAEELAKLPQYAGLTVTEYVFKYHALVSIPTIGVMATLHYFWQKFMDKKQGYVAKREASKVENKEIEGSLLFKTVYAILPLFPIFILLGAYAVQVTTGTTVAIGVELATLISFMVAIFCELIRHKGNSSVLGTTQKFFDGMGNSISIVALLVAASVFVTGLKSIGLISALQDVMTGLNGSGMGFVLPLILVLITALIVILSGSGVALFYAMVPLMVPLAEAAGISAFAVSIPMGIAGNLLRAVSPVAAVIIIIAGSTKENPMDIIKRTAVPMIGGTIFMFILSMMMFL